MKFLSSIIFLVFACATQAFAQAPQPTDNPDPAQKIKDLRWATNIILTQQLPSSLPDSLNGKQFRKVFSFGLPQTGSDALEVREIRKSVEQDLTFGGSKYLLSTKDLDLSNIKIHYSEDGLYAAIVIPLKQGAFVTHSPYGNEPERQLPALVIGWYERLQDKTLARAMEAVKQYLLAVCQG